MQTRQQILLVGVAILCIDQAAKALIGEPLPGAASAFLLAGGAVVAALACAAYWFGWRKGRNALLAALTLICSGSASNWLDRGLRGHVLVFLPWLTGRRFNLADAAIVIGTLVLLALLVRWVWSKLVSSGPSSHPDPGEIPRSTAR
ncbi:MAG: signal peptidase II [Myxococcaceae bacterium]|nr:signal peptidase II [Myxococcaceae bacterium]